jgi:hypothetical protein
MCNLKHPDTVPAGAGTYQDLFALFAALLFIAPAAVLILEHFRELLASSLDHFGLLSGDIQ